MALSNKRITKALIRLRGCAGWSAPLLFANPRRQVLFASRPSWFLVCNDDTQKRNALVGKNFLSTATDLFYFCTVFLHETVAFITPVTLTNILASNRLFVGLISEKTKRTNWRPSLFMTLISVLIFDKVECSNLDMGAQLSFCLRLGIVQQITQSILANWVVQQITHPLPPDQAVV